MPDMLRAARELYALEELARGSSVLHRLHPGVKLLAAAGYIVVTLSFDRHSFGRLLPFLLYPSVLIALGDIPLGPLLKRVVLALPFCLLAGLSNLIFEREAALWIGPVPVSFGLLSLGVLCLRTFLCVSAALILMALTPFPALTAQLRRFGLPPVFVNVLEMTYRYVTVLLEEGFAMYTAYRLRSGGRGGVAMKHIGSVIGHLFLRCVDRAERIHAAMRCRGYGLSPRRIPGQPLSVGDGIFLALTGLGCLLFRLMDLPRLMGLWLGGLGPLSA